MQEKSRILVFTTAYRPMIGGSELALEEIIRRLPDIFFDIITPRHKRVFKAKESSNNSNIYRIGTGTTIDKILFLIFGFFKSLSLIRINDYKIIQAYQASYGGGICWGLKLLYPRLSFILTLQEGKDLNNQNVIFKLLRNLIIKRADIITAISGYLADYASKVNPRAKVIIIPNGVDLTKFQIPNHKSQTNFKFQIPNSKIIITVSRLVEKNGVGDLVDALHVLNTKHQIPDTKYKLLIIGDGPLKESLRLKAKRLKLENKVEFLGEVSNNGLPSYLAKADIFVRPSLSEGLGTAFLEAMAAGVPIIGTSVGGISDFLKDGETGLFCRV
ncbi:MAG: glycosyltransferase family 4 protein, partial [Patescibacteria group bacterium]